MKKLYLVIFSLLTGITSCMEEQLTDTLTIGENERVNVCFSINLPTPDISTTRAMNEESENSINELDILVFKMDGGNEYFTDHVRVVSPITDSGTPNKKTFNATIVVKPYQQRFVFIANASGRLEALTPNNQLKADVLANLTVTNAGKWDARSPSQFDPIPMWGESKQTSISLNTTSFPETIHLHRMVARIDVKMGSADAKNNFKLKKVFLYNRNTKGMIAPFTDAAHWDAKAGKVIRASIPSEPGRIKEALEYAVMTTPDEALEKTVYTFETIAAAKADEATSIVVGGLFGNDTDDSYYRIDFFDKSKNPVERIDLLRNHKYVINITKVIGPGRKSPDDAFNSAPVNMETEILEWNEGEIGDIVFNGQHYLGVNPVELSLFRDAVSGIGFTVTTDVTEGWSIIDVTDSPLNNGNPASWIKNINPVSSNTGGKTEVKFDVEENATGTTRIAYIHIKADRLRFAMKIVQGTKPDVRLRITDANDVNDIQELVFSSAAGVQPNPKSFNLKWMPSYANVSISKTDMGEAGFTYASGNDKPGKDVISVSDQTGKIKFTIQPTALTEAETTNNPFLEKTSKVDFTLSNGGIYVSHSLFLRQINFNTVVEPIFYYNLDGGVYSLPVRSNTEWKIKQGSLNDPHGIIAEIDMNQHGEYNTSTGNPITFRMKNYNTNDKNDKKATLVLTDPTGRMKDVTVAIRGLNCGIEGVAVPRKIGENTYLTHIYGDKCWMVQNLKEPGYAKRYYNNNQYNDNGAYYSYSQAPQACPAGWRLPVKNEVENLRSTISKYNSRNFKYEPLMRADVIWWCGSQAGTSGLTAFAGSCIPKGSNNQNSEDSWNSWGTTGYWRFENGKNVFFGQTDAFVISSIENNVNYYSVRCVREN